MKKVLAVISGLVLGTSVAVAEQAFEDIDTDSDGAISAEESVVIPELAAEFKTVDVDQDGRLSKEEYEAATKAE